MPAPRQPRRLPRKELCLPEGAPPIVYIRWRDACFSSDTTPVEAANGLVELHEIGWLLAESPEAVTIGMEWEPGMLDTRFYLNIPKVNITELYYLVPHKKRGQK